MAGGEDNPALQDHEAVELGASPISFNLLIVIYSINAIKKDLWFKKIKL